MFDVIAANSRGAGNLDWLQSRHTFSFGDYFDPERVSFGSLRVVNEDWIAPGKGFGTHPHRDMEIITYMLDGELEHKDSMGNGSVIRPGELQRMTAGTGVLHSEFNASNETTAHLLQIWILPEANGLQPGYEQREFAAGSRQNRWRLIGSRDGRDGSLTIHQDVNLYAALLDASATLELKLDAGRLGFVQVAKGTLEVDGRELEAGDALRLAEPAVLQLRASSDAELLFFDMGQ